MPGPSTRPVASPARSVEYTRAPPALWHGLRTVPLFPPQVSSSFGRPAVRRVAWSGDQATTRDTVGQAALLVRPTRTSSPACPTAWRRIGLDSRPAGRNSARPTTGPVEDTGGSHAERNARRTRGARAGGRRRPGADAHPAAAGPGARGLRHGPGPGPARPSAAGPPAAARGR